MFVDGLCWQVTSGQNALRKDQIVPFEYAQA
jgi:hypothetical protein